MRSGKSRQFEVRVSGSNGVTVVAVPDAVTSREPLMALVRAMAEQAALQAFAVAVTTASALTPNADEVHDE